MKLTGIFLIVLGFLLGVFALDMDVSVGTAFGQRVNNIGLMNDRQNTLMIAATLFIAGIILCAVSNKSGTDRKKCPYCSEYINAEAIKCKHCGSEIRPIDDNGAWKWTAESYYTVSNGMPILNKAAVADFVTALVKDNPGKSNEEITEKYQYNIFSLVDKLPSQIRKEFVDFYYEAM